MITVLDKLVTMLPADPSSEKTIKAGDHLFRQQQPALAIFGVKAGRIRLYRDLTDGSSVTLHVARSGQTFAEAALFAEHYHCHALAEIDSTIVLFNSSDIMQAMSHSPALAINMSRQLATQVRDMRALLSLRDIRSADERLLAWIRLKANGQTLSLQIDRTWAGISEELGLSKEAVYRSLSKLQQQHIIVRERGSESTHETVSLLRAH